MEVPLIGVLERLLIKPLDYDSSIKLAIAINKNIRMDEAREIAEISGGIPKHIISIALRYRAGESVIKTAELLLDLGEFDEVFESMLRFLAEIAKRDFSLFVLVLKAIAEGNRSTEKIAEYTGLDKSQAYYILEELKKLDLLRKTKKGKFVIYDLQYPLLGAWLLKRVEPINTNREKLLQMLGITAESYIRELLRQIKNRIEIWDDKRGTYLAGTANKIELERMDVLDLEDTKKFLAKIENADIICKTKEGYLIIEVKAKDKPIVPEDIKKLNKTLKKLTKKGLNVKGILIQVGYGEILPTAVVEAVKNNIIIITREGIRLLAKKLDFPPI